MAKINTVRPGQVIKQDGELWAVTKMIHGTPGNKRAFYQVTMKNLARGNVVTNKYSADEDVDVAFMDTKTMEYLYRDGNMYCFMDAEDYEQHMIEEGLLRDTMSYVKENDQVRMRMHDGKPVSIELPAAVSLRVTKTDPGLKGNTVNNHFKPAELETGLSIKVPLYITEGESVKVDTRTGTFLERAKD